MIRRAGFGPPVRVGRPGLIGTAARTAVVAGTATAVSGGVSRRQENRAAAQQQDALYQQQRDQQQAAQQTAPQAGPSEDDRLARLQQLGQLRDQGVLSDQEFEAEKSRLLAT